jgi:hypothetical protein
VHPLLLVPPALVVALALDQGGFDPSAWVWSGALAAWAAATAAVAGRDLRLSRGAWGWLASACALLGWVGMSWLWSERRVQTVLEARRTAIYAAAVLALLVLVRRERVRLLLLSTHAALVVVVVYALTRYLTETRTVDTFEGALLAQPLGYANALGALAAIGVVLGVGLAACGRSPWEHAIAAATVPLFAGVLPLTHSRGAPLALGAGLVVTVVLSDDAAQFLRAALIATPGAALAAAASALSHLSDAGAKPHAHAGLVIGAAVVVGAAATAIGAVHARPHRAIRRRAPRPVIAVVLVLAAAATVAAGRATEPRASLWRVAWHEFEGHVAVGSGAGTFALAWVRSGLVGARGGALDAHSLYLETLAELGLVGLLLLLVFLALPLAHPRVRSGHASVAAGAYVVFLVHAGLDWDWEMPAVVLAGLCCGAAALGAGEDQARSIGSRGRASIVLLALLLGVASIAGARSSSEPGVAPSLLVPVLGARAVGLPVLRAQPVRLTVPVALSVPVLRSELSRAGRIRVAVAEVRLHGPRRDGDLDPRMLPRVRAVAQLHAVLRARGPVLTAGGAVLTARRAVLAARRAVLAARCAVLV